jgi:hypothetical protein
MDESSDIIAITPAACKNDIDKEWSKPEIEHWEKFLKRLEDQDYVNSYREYIVMLKEKAVNKPIVAEDLEKKGYEAWEEDEEIVSAIERKEVDKEGRERYLMVGKRESTPNLPSWTINAEGAILEVRE